MIWETQQVSAKPSKKKKARDRKPDLLLIDLATYDQLKRVEDAGHVLGMHRSGTWQVLSKRLEDWEELRDQWRSSKGCAE